MKRTIIRTMTALAAAMLITPVVFGAGLDKRFKIIPMPQKVEVSGANGIRWSELSFVAVEQGAEYPVLGENLDRLPRYKAKGKGVVLEISLQGVPESDEGYVLTLGRGGIRIRARSGAGLFYGCQTLEQMITDCRQFGMALPEAVITDYPAVPFRSIHIDNKHHLDRTEYYYSLIDKLASYKINGIIWEIDDKLRYSRRPEVGCNNALSKQEMQAISRYAMDRNIRISPLVQGLGHACYILKHHWELRESPASDWEFCPSNPETYDMLFDLYRDAMEAMPYGQFLHVGGDEISEIGIDERCKATGKTPFELQMYWLEKVCRFAVGNGRQPIFWDDMPLKHGNIWYYLHFGVPDEQVRREMTLDKVDEAIELFPKECVYMRWHYEDATILPNIMVLDWYRNKGLKVMAATSASDGAGPFVPRHNARAQYIKDFSRLAAEYDLVGIFSTAWGDGSNHLETVVRGFIAQGEFGWNPTGRTVDEFKGAHAQREFGLAPEQILFLDDVERAAFFFDGALVTSGRRNPACGVDPFTLIDLPDRQKPGEWTEKYGALIDSAHVESNRYEKIAAGFAEAALYTLRNRNTLEVYDQTARMLNYPVRLILALEEYDRAGNDAERAAAMDGIREECAYFDRMRSDLLEVYSRTRFMEVPEGYIMDMNHHHHLAAQTHNGDWMFYYEIPMIKKIRRWMEE